LPEPRIKTMGRYEIQEEIGRGMMGVVYRALDPALGRSVALKTVQLGFMISDHDREVFDKRFLSEARVAAALSHPSLVVVHDLGHDPETGLLFIAFEYLNGWTLAEITAGGVPMDPDKALYVSARVAEALDYAHRQGVVHRDIKPANVMVLPSGEPKVMDFGVAKVPTSQLTAAGEFFGTPSYMSPEQAAGHAVDGRSDLFSLGSVLYLLLTGKRAFEGPSVTAILTRIAHDTPEPPSRVVPSLPRGVDQIVERALQKDPELRYPDGRTMAADIEDVRAGRPPRNAVRPQAFGSGAHAHADATIDVWVPGLSTGGHDGGRRRDNLLTALVLTGAVALTVALWRGGMPQAAPSAAPAATAPAVPLPSPQLSWTWASPLPSGAPPALESPAADTARLTLLFDHPFKAGTLRVYVDDALQLTEPLLGKPHRKLLLFRSHEGTEREVLELLPGPHTLRLDVRSDGFHKTRTIRGRFEAGKMRTLSASVGGGDKDISVTWGRR
jgi:tRNA A-37 threonylcarbamoyl transferase component Bud32